MTVSGSQQLYATNVSADLEGALEARTKDPLWFLARQWQLGEFEAETGGLPMQVYVTARIYPLERCETGEEVVPIHSDAPLEYFAEKEPEDGTPQPPGWQSASLDYDFTLRTERHRLEVRGYDGRALDWHDVHFARGSGQGGERQDFNMIPGQLQIRGVPETRFWEIEDRAAYFDAGDGAEPNILSLMLPEFFYTDIKNWYTIPAPMPSGSVREIEQVTAVDSFGVATQLDPIGDRDAEDPFSLFALDAEDQSPTDSSVLLCLNTAARVGENDLLEEVRFLRDEAANLVWAWERQLTGADGLFATALEPKEDSETAPETSAPGLRFRLKSETARAFIPYVPRQTADVPAIDGDIALRRARSGESYSVDNPQYRGAVVAEAKHVHEESIPHSGLRIRRIRRYARGSDNEVYFWVGRDRAVGGATRKPRLTFDDILPAES